MRQPKNIAEEQQRDNALYFVEDGEAGFNPEWNKAVIERTIKKTDALRRRKHKDYLDKLGERSDAVATYLKSRAAEGSTPIEKYFGKRYMSYLSGRKIMDKIQTLKLHQKTSIKGVIPGIRKVYLPGD